MLRYLSLVLIVPLFVVAGCGGNKGPMSDLKETWEVTRDFVNPPPTISTDRYQIENPNQVKLAELFAPVDGPLTTLATFVENTDTIPDIDWLELLIARFPWVNTVLVTDEKGNIIFMQPETPIKELSKPLTFEGEWRNRPLITRVDYTDLGPEMYIGRPYFKDIAFRGIIGVGFDPRALLTLSPNPKELFIVQPGKGVFARGPVDKDVLLGVDWETLLIDNVHGQVEAGGKHYTWIVRYIGKDPYIYATESVEANVDTGWF